MIYLINHNVDMYLASPTRSVFSLSFFQAQDSSSSAIIATVVTQMIKSATRIFILVISARIETSRDTFQFALPKKEDVRARITFVAD